MKRKSSAALDTLGRAEAATADLAGAKAVLLYDGVCGLCNRLVRFTLRRDHSGLFRFAPLQSRFAHEALARYGKNAGDLDSVYVLADFGRETERLLARADAILYLLRAIGGIWRLSTVGCLVPHAVRDWAYGFVARRRYRWFGRYDSCTLPDAVERTRFIELT